MPARRGTCVRQWRPQGVACVGIVIHESGRGMGLRSLMSSRVRNAWDQDFHPPPGRMIIRRRARTFSKKTSRWASGPNFAHAAGVSARFFRAAALAAGRLGVFDHLGGYGWLGAATALLPSPSSSNSFKLERPDGGSTEPCCARAVSAFRSDIEGVHWRFPGRTARAWIETRHGEQVALVEGDERGCGASRTGFRDASSSLPCRPGRTSIKLLHLCLGSLSSSPRPPPRHTSACRRSRSRVTSRRWSPRTWTATAARTGRRLQDRSAPVPEEVFAISGTATACSRHAPI